MQTNPRTSVRVLAAMIVAGVALTAFSLHHAWNESRFQRAPTVGERANVMTFVAKRLPG